MADHIVSLKMLRKGDLFNSLLHIRSEALSHWTPNLYVDTRSTQNIDIKTTSYYINYSVQYRSSAGNSSLILIAVVHKTNFYFMTYINIYRRLHNMIFQCQLFFHYTLIGIIMEEYIVHSTGKILTKTRMKFSGNQKIM